MVPKVRLESRFGAGKKGLWQHTVWSASSPAGWAMAIRDSKKAQIIAERWLENKRRTRASPTNVQARADFNGSCSIVEYGEEDGVAQHGVPMDYDDARRKGSR